MACLQYVLAPPVIDRAPTTSSVSQQVSLTNDAVSTRCLHPSPLLIESILYRQKAMYLPLWFSQIDIAYPMTGPITQPMSTKASTQPRLQRIQTFQPNCLGSSSSAIKQLTITPVMNLSKIGLNYPPRMNLIGLNWQTKLLSMLI